MSPAAARLRLSPSADIAVTVVDQSVGGSPLHHRRPDDLVREAFAPVLRAWTEDGMEWAAGDLPRLIDESRQTAAFDRLLVSVGDRWMVRPEVLHPDSTSAWFSEMTVSCGDQNVTASIDSAQWPDVHRLVAALAGPGIRTDRADRTEGAGRGNRAEKAVEPASIGDRVTSDLMASGQMVDDLVAAWQSIGAVEIQEAGKASPTARPEAVPIVFHGHNTVSLSSSTTTVLVDPFLRPPHPYDETPYRPYSVAEIGPVDALVITHSHPDHFAPGTLLRFDPAIPVIVPRTGPESVLTIDLALRLRQLGFDTVIELPWWSTVEIGDVRITALPFYGEQPTDSTWMHPEVRNEGNTYLVSAPEWSVALLADAGHDDRGSTTEMAREAASRYGSPDLVFGGYRAWQVRPFQLLRSSVARYLLLVPPDQWNIPQQLMAGIEDLLDTAAAFGARSVVPYADGGAPWYWQMGLGPRLDAQPSEHPDLDPFPERVLDADQRRGTQAGVLLARPNDGLTFGPPAVEIVRPDDNGWPYAARVAAADG